MKHPHAEIIKALADDDSLTLWQRSAASARWLKVNPICKVWFVANFPEREYHIGLTPPSVIVYTEYGSYPLPLQEAPPVGTPVFWARFLDGETIGAVWGAYGRARQDWLMECLRSGIVHLTKEAAEQQAKVELALRLKRHKEAMK